MAIFKFEALDGSGKQVRGTVEADSLKLARSRMRDMQLTPVNVEPLQDSIQQGAHGLSWLTRRQHRLSTSDVCLMTRQFSTLLQAGLPVGQALSAMVEQSEQANIKEVLQTLRAEVLAGKTLSEAFALFPQTFSDVYRAIIVAGEESGELSMVMEKLADYTESRNQLKQKVVAAFIYPALVTLVASLVIAGLLVYVVPQVVGAFEQSRQVLPWLTRALIAVSDVVRAVWLYVLVAIIGGGVVFKKMLKDAEFRFKFHARLLTLPVMGALIKGINTARLASTLAILVGSGVPIMRALRAASNMMSNLPMKQAVEAAMEKVRDGAPLSRALKTGQLFPPILIHLISSAESTGKLDEMLERAAQQQSRELENKVGVMTALLEPVLILVMGGVVLLIVLAILMPIIEMNQLIK